MAIDLNSNLLQIAAFASEELSRDLTVDDVVKSCSRMGVELTGAQSIHKIKTADGLSKLTAAIEDAKAKGVTLLVSAAHLANIPVTPTTATATKRKGRQSSGKKSVSVGTPSVESEISGVKDGASDRQQQLLVSGAFDGLKDMMVRMAGTKLFYEALQRAIDSNGEELPDNPVFRQLILKAIKIQSESLQLAGVGDFFVSTEAIELEIGTPDTWAVALEQGFDALTAGTTRALPQQLSPAVTLQLPGATQ